MDNILKDLVEGKISLAEAKDLLGNKVLEIEDYAKIDVNREIRTGIPEVILCSGKSDRQIMEITERTLLEKEKVILSRVPSGLMDSFNVSPSNIRKYPEANMIVVSKKEEGGTDAEIGERPLLGVITAGTADIPVAMEAVICAREMGCEIFSAFDVGVAGIHRLLPVIKNMNEKGVKVIVVAAGREGALPSVVAGLLDSVVIALPVSLGYGYGGRGKAALMGMLQSCTPLLVVNIDAGVIAGMMGAKISKMLNVAKI